MKTKLLQIMALFKIKKKKAKHCNLSASLSYPGIHVLRQTIENCTCKVS